MPLTTEQGANASMTKEAISQRNLRLLTWIGVFAPSLLKCLGPRPFGVGAPICIEIYILKANLARLTIASHLWKRLGAISNWAKGECLKGITISANMALTKSVFVPKLIMMCWAPGLSKHSVMLYLNLILRAKYLEGILPCQVWKIRAYYAVSAKIGF